MRRTCSPRSVSYTHLDVYKRQVIETFNGQYLIKAGCKNGDEVRILGYAFDFEGIDDDEDYDCLLYTSRCV